MPLCQEVFQAVFDRQKNADRVDAQGALPILYRQLGNGFAATGHSCVGINAVNTAIGVNARTEEVLVGTTKGVVKCRTVRRFPEEQRWDYKLD